MKNELNIGGNKQLPPFALALDDPKLQIWLQIKSKKERKVFCVKHGVAELIRQR